MLMAMENPVAFPLKPKASRGLNEDNGKKTYKINLPFTLHSLALVLRHQSYLPSPPPFISFVPCS